MLLQGAEGWKTHIYQINEFKVFWLVLVIIVKGAIGGLVRELTSDESKSVFINGGYDRLPWFKGK